MLNTLYLLCVYGGAMGNWIRFPQTPLGGRYERD